MTHKHESHERISGVLVVDNAAHCDLHAAQLLIAFAMPEVRALSRRRTLDQVLDALLWCAFAWNHGARGNAAETLAQLEHQHGREMRDYLARLFERRVHARTSTQLIGPIRVSRLRSGAVAVHVDGAADQRVAARQLQR